MAKGGKQNIFYGYVIVISCFVMMVIWWGSFHSFGVFFESLLDEFHWSRAITAGAFSLHNITFGIFSIPIARLCSRYQPRIVIGICGFLGGLGYLLMSQVSSIWQMYLLYGVLMSISMGSYISILPIVIRWFVHRRGWMTGVVFSGMGIGMMLVPPLVSRLISTYDWRNTYTIVGVVLMVGLVFGSQFLRRDPFQEGKIPDAEGNLKSSSVIPESQGLSYGRALKTNQFWFLGALYFIYLISHNTATVHIVIHAIGQGVAPLSAARLLSVFGILLILGFNIIGIIADRLSNRSSFIISFLLMTLAFIPVLSMNEVWTLYVFVSILGFACGGAQVLFSPIVAELFGLRSHGEILATMGFIGGIGAAVGAALAGYIFDVTGEYRLAFIICALLSATAITLAWFVKPLTQNEIN